ncbi:MAG: RIO1 family regulatory kinase/ATPase [Chloroflexota bacterium]
MDKYDAYERYEEYQYVDNSRQARRRRQGKDPSNSARRYRQKKARRMAQMSDRMEDFVPTYVANMAPEHHERQWLIDSLSSFYGNDQIRDVLRLVKGGKEANVYACRANPKLGMDLAAAKLYRPRMLRHLKNNAVYKEGRFLRDADGKLILGSREERAMAKKTRFGKDLDLAAWIGHEFEMQTLLFEAGADVPRPLAHGGNVILMAYVGEETMPAPTLHEVSLAPEEAQPLFERVMTNVEIMLRHHMVHADLSAYNILYWQGRITLIDFPQMVDARSNPNTLGLLLRDVERVCDYFAAYDIEADAAALADGLWRRYMNAEL